VRGAELDRYLRRRERGRERELVTPEGVPLRLTLASVGDRAAALAIDLVVLYGGLIAVLVLTALAAGGDLIGGGWVVPFVMVFTFLLQNFYFIFFELRWRGATPGKRAMGVRVVDRRGGALSVDAVVARNLVRDLEVFLPLQALLAPELLIAHAPGWALLLASAWLFLFALMPLFNRDRLRVGDMVAGTLVVIAPRALLLPDVGAASTAARGAAYEFTNEQLAIYGIYELQVLEGVLRQDPTTIEYAQAVDTVCEKIKHKVSWPRDQWQVEPERFLGDFYAALRARLERDMLFGKRQEDKFGKRS
jgi:uncharacterized RDD family membrane protein YckC